MTRIALFISHVDGRWVATLYRPGGPHRRVEHVGDFDSEADALAALTAAVAENGSE